MKKLGALTARVNAAGEGADASGGGTTRGKDSSRFHLLLASPLCSSLITLLMIHAVYSIFRTNIGRNGRSNLNYSISITMITKKKRNPVTGEFSAHTEHLGSMLFP